MKESGELKLWTKCGKTKQPNEPKHLIWKKWIWKGLWWLTVSSSLWMRILLKGAESATERTEKWYAKGEMDRSGAVVKNLGATRNIPHLASLRG